MGWTKKKINALYKGKGYEPDHKTKDKDLIIPEAKQDDPYWPELDPKADLCEIYARPEEPQRYSTRAGYRTVGRGRDWSGWGDRELSPAPANWSPRQ